MNSLLHLPFRASGTRWQFHGHGRAAGQVAERREDASADQRRRALGARAIRVFSIGMPVVAAIACSGCQSGRSSANELCAATDQGNIQNVRSLLAAGANPNVLGSAGLSALCCTGRNDRADIAKLLVDAGAHVNEKSAAGFAALFYASSSKKGRVVTLLLQRGADPNGTAPTGWSALGNAVASGSNAAAYPLIGAGADVNAVQEGMFPLEWASRRGDIPLARRLLHQGARINAHTPNGGTALMGAVVRGRFDVVRFLLASGADPVVKYKDGRTAAEMAVKLGRLDIILALRQAAKVRVKGGPVKH